MGEKMLFGVSVVPRPHTIVDRPMKAIKSRWSPRSGPRCRRPKGRNNTRSSPSPSAGASTTDDEDQCHPDGYMPVLVVAADDEVDLPAFGQLEEEVGEQRADGALGEIEHARRPEGEHQTERREGIEAAHHRPKQHDRQEIRQRHSPEERAARAAVP